MNALSSFRADACYPSEAKYSKRKTPSPEGKGWDPGGPSESPIQGFSLGPLRADGRGVDDPTLSRRPMSASSPFLGKPVATASGWVRLMHDVMPYAQ